MVRNQVPAPNAHAVYAAMFNQKVAVQVIVSITKERLRPPMATLGDMVGRVGNYDACESSHRKMIAGAEWQVYLVHCHRNPP